MIEVAHLADRAVLAVSGGDRVSFLNGLVSNDVAEVAPGRAVWAALLTPQGKWLADFFIFTDGEALLLDCEAGQSAWIAARLLRYRLRADVALGAVGLQVYAAWGGAPGVPEGAVVAADPRLAAAGFRVLSGVGLAANASAADYDLHRIRLGLPDGSRDMESEKTVLLEAGFDLLHGVSWTKGCYMGQELTARTKYRGLLKRRLVPVRAVGGMAATGCAVTCEGRDVGEVRSVRGEWGLAVLRLEAMGGVLEAGGQKLTVEMPGWAKAS